MNLNIAWSLLAETHRFDGLRDRFSGPKSHFGWGDALTALFVLVAISVGLFFVNRWHSRHSGRRSYNSPRALFRELCKEHRLNRPTRKLLKRMARWQRLKQPSRLFLEPERFEPANLSPDLQQQSVELFELRSQLFTFEVAPESRDSMSATMTDDAASSIAEKQEPKSVTENGGAGNHEAQEAVGAAAFASTTLEELHKEDS